MKKMTLNTLNKIVSLSPTTSHTISFDVDGEVINIEVKPYISLQEISDIVDTASQAAFTESGFSPEYKEAVLKYKIIDTLTNIPTLKSKDTVDLVKYNEIYDKLNLRDKIMNINDYMWDLMVNLESMIDEKLEFQKSLICHPDRDSEIVNAVVGFFDNLNSVVGNLEKNFGNIDMEKALPLIGEMSKNIAEGKVLSRENINTILEVGSVGKNNLEVVK
jgi:hypothetical protein